MAESINSNANRDKDDYLKFGIMSYLWKIGYVVGRNVSLLSFDKNNTKFELTDVDVLGIKFDETFNKIITICDCRTGSSSSIIERIVFIKGLATYLNAHNCIFVRDKINESKYSEMAKEMDIRLLSSSQLKNHLLVVGIDDDEIEILSEIQRRQSSILNLFKTVSKEYYEYAVTRNWMDKPNQRILSLIKICQFVTASKTMNEILDENGKIFILGYLMSLLIIAIIDFSKDIIYLKDEEKDESIKQNLIGGRIEFYEKKLIITSIYDFFWNEIKKKYNKNYDVSKVDFINGISPPYAKYLSDFIIRICDNPLGAIYIPRIIDILIHNLTQTDPKYSRFISDIVKWTDTNAIDLCLDFITFAVRSNFIDDNVRNVFEKELRKVS